MVKCSSCGEKFDELPDFDVHARKAVCAAVTPAGVARHAVRTTQRRNAKKRGAKVAEVSAPPKGETRGLTTQNFRVPA